MSRTDKTRPWAVKALDRPEYLVEHHDHRDRECNLPPRPVGHADPFGPDGSDCGWKASHTFWMDPVNNCGCALCTGQVSRRAERRRDRREGRRAARNWQSEW